MHYSLARATAWNLSSFLYLFAASFVAVPITIRYMGLEMYSTYILIIATISMVSAIDFGLTPSVVRELSRELKQSKRRAVWSTSLILFTVTGLLAGLVASVILAFLGQPLSVLGVVFLSAFANNILAHYLTLPQSLGRFGYYNVKSYIVGTALTLGTAAMAVSHFGLLPILIVQLLAQVLCIAILFVMSLRHFGSMPVISFDPKSARSVIDFGLKNQAGKIMGQVGANYGKYLLAAISPLAVSAYSIAQSLVYRVTGAIAVFSNALYPAMSRREPDASLIRTYHRLQFVLLLLGILSLSVYQLFGPQFLEWWLDDRELALAVHRIMSVFIWYFAILLLTPLPSTVLDSRGRPGLTSIFVAIPITIEISLAYYLLPVYGLLAPPIAALVALVIVVPVLLAITEKVLRDTLK